MPQRSTSESLMPFGDHLDELRRRVLRAIYGLVPILALSLFFGGTMLEFVMRPVKAALIRAGQSPTVAAMGPLEVFGAYIKVSFLIAIIVGSPWIMYQLWLFVSPGLYAHERRFA